MDQKSLVSIYRKHMVNISPWIQKLMFRSFPYQPFDVWCVPGKEIPLVDALSHVSPLTEGEDDGIHLPIIAINEVTRKILLPTTQLEEI